MGPAWLAAVLALALHVLDEATHDFLAWYNPQALRIRRLLGGVPFPPTFTFWPWLIALAVVTVLLGALTPLAYHDAAALRGAAYVVGAIHVANGLLHITATLVARRPVPGVLSAPFLLAAGLWLLLSATG